MTKRSLLRLLLNHQGEGKQCLPRTQTCLCKFTFTTVQEVSLQNFPGHLLVQGLQLMHIKIHLSTVHGSFLPRAWKQTHGNISHSSQAHAQTSKFVSNIIIYWSTYILVQSHFPGPLFQLLFLREGSCFLHLLFLIYWSFGGMVT